jgi:DNA-binding Lrp family transcriptional regulator
VDGLVRADILDFETIHDLRAMMLLLAMLRQRVGSPVSHTSIARDIGISPSTVIKYLQILEALYIIFRVTPWSYNIARSLLKEPKIYFFDTGMVDGTAGVRFENFMAVSLLKHLYGLADYRGEETGLFYVRTKDGREVDFCLVKKNSPETLLECKTSEKTVSPQRAMAARVAWKNSLSLSTTVRKMTGSRWSAKYSNSWSPAAASTSAQSSGCGWSSVVKPLLPMSAKAVMVIFCFRGQEPTGRPVHSRHASRASTA